MDKHTLITIGLSAVVTAALVVGYFEYKESKAKKAGAGK